MPWRSRRRLASGLLSLVILAGLAGCAGHRHPALGVIGEYEGLTELDVYDLKPYFANLYALDLLRRGRGVAETAEYIDWYLANLNDPDRHGLTGSIDDFTVHRGGRQQAAGSYDSADAYAATFIMLLDAYARAADARELCERHRGRIEDIAWLMLYLQDADGLVWALPDGDAKYLMDNCEVHAGMQAFRDLSARMGWPDGERYAEAARRLREGVMRDMYDPDARRFHWAVDAAGAHRSDWDRFYPDALAQLFPVLHDLVPRDGELARHLWRSFDDRHEPGRDFPASTVQRLIVKMAREKVEER